MNKQRILNIMAGLESTADDEEEKLVDFLPLKSYAILGEADRFLIIGGRGSGKTRIFKTLLCEGGFEQILGNRPRLFAPNAGNSEFIAGYQKKDHLFPAHSVMRKLIDEDDIEAFWAGSIVYLVLQHFSGNVAIQELGEKCLGSGFFWKMQSEIELKNPFEWLEDMKDNPEKWEDFLDCIDEYLEENDKWLFIAYDSLDRITSRYDDLFSFIRILLSFWFEHLHRWKRLKCKIFLRNDLYASGRLNFPDASKMANNCLRLEWTHLSLYQLLIKRLANAGDEETIAYLKLTDGLISEEPDKVLGYLPTERQEIIQQFVNEMIGPYMGSGAKKGASYGWAPNHLQDAKGVLAPRSFIKCFSVAATKMLERIGEMEKLVQNRLLLPTMIQGAVQEVSEARVEELREEYPWLVQLKAAFKGITLLVERQELLQRIDMDLLKEKHGESLPASTPEGIFDTLQELGIVFVANDGRVNVPEIYLHGFGMKRKGGLKRLT